MSSVKQITALGLGLFLSACGVVDIPSRSASDPGLLVAPQDQKVATGPRSTVMLPQYRVTAVRVAVPQSLRVSEANVYYPIADIVWRGEPYGNRHAQVKAIFDEAMATGTRAMTKGPEVIVDVQVTRFHCLTEKTRYTLGGVHSLHFILTVRDAKTGAVLDGPRPVVADVKASGGAIALAEEERGITQRSVILQRLAQVIRRELSVPVDVPQDQPAARLDSDLRLIPAVVQR